MSFRFESSYLNLPPSMYSLVQPAVAPQASFAMINTRLADSMGIEAGWLNSDKGLSYLSGSKILAGTTPFAQAYAGHQFGHFTMLGDGRAIMLGEHTTPDGKRFDIQLKGAGQTPYSRRGDGKAALGPMLREYIMSEAMYYLGVPTTRSLAVVSTGEPVYREQVLEGAILTRVALSHIRVGTFEFAAAIQDEITLKAFADYTIQRHDPELMDRDDRYLAFFKKVMDRQTSLIAKWMHVGFIHGVMNTDNMAISGETIDYGPCAFMNTYDPATVYSSIDHQGRYAYANQPAIAHWNLTRLAETLLPLFHADKEVAITMAQQALDDFQNIFHTYFTFGLRKKLGLKENHSEDRILIEELFRIMQSYKADYTNTFRSLCDDLVAPPSNLLETPAWLSWKKDWEHRLTMENISLGEIKKNMRQVNPFLIPRNHLVEQAIFSATVEKNLSFMHQFLQALETPYDSAPEHLNWTLPPQDDSDYQTFCGT